MTKKTAVVHEVIPLHTYLHRRVAELPDVTNKMIAEALDYPKPNVVSMMLTGSMKVPVRKVPELARVLELHPLGLLRRVMLADMPEVWETIEEVVGVGRLNTANEVALLDHVRAHLGGADLPLMDDAQFASALTRAILGAINRHARKTLATRSDDRAPGDSRSARENAEMIALLRRQADERAALMRSFGEDD